MPAARLFNLEIELVFHMLLSHIADPIPSDIESSVVIATRRWQMLIGEFIHDKVALLLQRRT